MRSNRVVVRFRVLPKKSASKLFGRTLAPFFRLYHYTRDAQGGTEHQALLGLFSLRDLPASEDRAEYFRVSLLFGLFQYRNLGGERGLRFLWLPEIAWGASDQGGGDMER